MNRKILIISNPGEKNAENYCEGVNVDVSEYIEFFKSIHGGAWYEHEIITLNLPTSNDVDQALEKLKSCDYSIVIFCGHGYYSKLYDDTIIELSSGYTYKANSLRNGSTKRTIILDCCRKIYDDIAESILESSMFNKFEHRATLSKADARTYYENELKRCYSGIVLLSACSIDETAGDDSKKGGYYSYSLRKVARQWSRESSNSVQSQSLSVVATHNAASPKVQQLTSDKQNPQIEKPRTMPYFPFVIK